MDRANEKRSQLLELKTTWKAKTEQLKIKISNYESYNFFNFNLMDQENDGLATLVSVKQSASDRKIERERCGKVIEAKKSEIYKNNEKMKDLIHLDIVKKYKKYRQQHLTTVMKNWSKEHNMEVENSKRTIKIQDLCVPAKCNIFETDCNIRKAFNCEDLILDTVFDTKMKRRIKMTDEKNHLQTLFGS